MSLLTVMVQQVDDFLLSIPSAAVAAAAARAGCSTPAGNQITCTIGDSWPAGSVIVITVPATATTTGAYTNTGRVQITGGNPITDTETVVINPVTPVSALQAVRWRAAARKCMVEGQPHQYEHYLYCICAAAVVEAAIPLL
jgi:hypothetical protein